MIVRRSVTVITVPRYQAHEALLQYTSSRYPFPLWRQHGAARLTDPEYM